VGGGLWVVGCGLGLGFGLALYVEIGGRVAGSSRSDYGAQIQGQRGAGWEVADGKGELRWATRVIDENSLRLQRRLSLDETPKLSPAHEAIIGDCDAWNCA
jgi:hypothetical protein